MMKNIEVVEQEEECKRKNECELREPSSSEECEAEAVDVRKTTFLMEEVNECVWGKKGFCKTY